ncbi:MAG: BrnT family toxin [Patescibacteria group bacterium]
MVVFKGSIEFDWDKGNIGKNKKHGVEDKESEEPFFDKKKVVNKDRFHSQGEERFILLGKTKKKRLLYISFTMRGEMKEKIRVISARDINKREVKFYTK